MSLRFVVGLGLGIDDSGKALHRQAKRQKLCLMHHSLVSGGWPDRVEHS